MHRTTSLRARLTFAAVALVMATAAAAEAPHTYGFHSWSTGCDIDVMNGKTGWYVLYHIINYDVNLSALQQAKGEGFTIIIGLFDTWDEEIPLDRAQWPAFAGKCARVAEQVKDYCHIFHLDNEMEGNSTGVGEFSECFRMVRDAIKGVHPDAIVSNGGTVGTQWFPKMAGRLGTDIDGYQTHVRVHPENMYALAGIPGGARKPYYITEFTQIPNYGPAFIPGYYSELNDWNENNPQECACACWFVYDLYGWYSHSLKWLPEPKADFQWVTANTDYTNEYAERPIVISDVRVDITSESGGAVSWETNIPSTTQIEWYGENALEGQVSGFDTNLKTQHWAVLSNCVPSYRYHLWLRSTALDYGDAAHGRTFGTNTSWSPDGWLHAGWNLVSLPLEPADPKIEKVFDVLTGAGNDLTNSLFAYDGSYVLYPNDFTTVEMGKGYWLHLIGNTGEYCEGLAVVEPVELELSQGWNLIGHPHVGPTALADCTVSDGVTTLPFPDAASAGWVQEPLYYYDNGYFTCAPAGGSDNALRPWRGYWLLTNTDDLTLIVP